jgi:hypothetical protein
MIEFHNDRRLLRRVSDGVGIDYTDGAGRRHKLYTWGDVPILVERIAACREALVRRIARPNRQLVMWPIWYEKCVREWQSKEESRARGK